MPYDPRSHRAFIVRRRVNRVTRILEDPGPAELNTGTADEPRMVPRSQAWQHLYTLLVLIRCEADYARLTAAARQIRTDIANSQSELGRERVTELSRAADLCEQAAKMVKDAGAVSDDKTRRRLIAGCEHETNMIMLGSAMPTVAESSVEALSRPLSKIDEEP